MNIKKIISSIALFMFSGSMLFAADNSSKSDPGPIFTEVDQDLSNAEEKIEKSKNSFIYLNGQTYFILPEIGIGYRYKNGFHGFDSNISVDPLIPAIATSASYLGYFNSKNNSSFYYGLGVSAMFPLDVVFPDVILGRQYNKMFFQLKVHSSIFPIPGGKSELSKPIFLPVPELSVGFGF